MPDRDGGSSLANVILGVIAFGAVGASVIALYLIARRALALVAAQEARDAFLPSFPLPALPPPVYALGGQEVPMDVDFPHPRRSAQTYSYNLGIGVSSRIATGFPEQDTDVMLYVVSPPGAMVLYSTNIATLNQANTASPTGDCSVIVAAGQPQTIRLASGVGLFARPSADGTIVSVTSTGV